MVWAPKVSVCMRVSARVCQGIELVQKLRLLLVLDRFLVVGLHGTAVRGVRICVERECVCDSMCVCMRVCVSVVGVCVCVSECE